jgi:hypothetical protein
VSGKSHIEQCAEWRERVLMVQFMGLSMHHLFGYAAICREGLSGLENFLFAGEVICKKVRAPRGRSS